MLPVRPFPALLLRVESERILVVADLHIGWEVTPALRGIHVPSQTSKILKRLLQLIKTCRPTSLILLGDVKHSIARVEMEEWRDIPDFFEVLCREISNVKVVLGNHDGNLEPLLPEPVEVLPSRGVVIGDLGLFHGHAWPTPELLGCRYLIMGHVHPMVALRDPVGFRTTMRIWLKAECDGKLLTRSLIKHLGIKADNNPVALLLDRFNIKLRSSTVFIMPSFNPFLGGQSVNRKDAGRYGRSRRGIAPVLSSGSINVGKAEMYLLDGTFLGTVEHMMALNQVWH